MRKSPFTLIEIVICMAILVTIGLSATIYGFRTYKVVQRNHAKAKLEEEILLTKILALTHQMDITLHFVQQGNNLVLTRTADYVPPKANSYFRHPITFHCLKLQEEKTVDFYSNNPSSFEFSLDLN